VTVRAALIGCGAWGKNLLRVLLESPRARLVAVADTHPARRADAALLAPGVAVVASLPEALAAGAGAVIIATPPESHAALALAALAAGADVFVEKPLALRVADAERCAARAAALGRVAMVGHLLRYHPSVERLIELGRSGALGELRRFESARLSVGGDRSASAAWTLGPHDLSVLHALDPGPIRVMAAREAEGGDPVRIEAQLATGLEASMLLSRASAGKERRMRLSGSRASASFDDVRAPDRVVLAGAGEAREIRVPWREPLAVEVDHFLRCVEERGRPRTPFEEGVTVVRALAAVEQACAAVAAEHALPAAPSF
jgi:predicted dehydrogenase